MTRDEIWKLADETNIWHIGIAALNLLCLIAALGGYFSKMGSVVAGAVFLGYVANAVAVVVAIAVALWLVISAFSGKARAVFRSHWLAIFNGVGVVVVWASLFAISAYFHL